MPITLMFEYGLCYMFLYLYGNVCPDTGKHREHYIPIIVAAVAPLV